MTYGPSLSDVGKQSARLVDQILKGTKPGDLPFEYVDLRLTLDLNLAEAIGLELPDSIVNQAQVILRRDLLVYAAPSTPSTTGPNHPAGTGACAAVQTNMAGEFKVCVTLTCDELLDSTMIS
jgi:hypothetical protein